MAACPWCDRVVLALHTHLLPPGMRHHWPRWHLPLLEAFLANEDWIGGPRSQMLTGEGLLGTQLPTCEMTMGTEPFLPARHSAKSFEAAHCLCHPSGGGHHAPLLHVREGSRSWHPGWCGACAVPTKPCKGDSMPPHSWLL